MAAEYRTTLTIEEVEGAESNRWSATLYGRALPKRDNPPKWGVQVEGEDTTPHGQSEATFEPVKITRPDLTFEGEWKLNALLTGDARAELTPDRLLRNPHDLCDWFESFAERSKVVDVTWTGGIVRRCRWVSATFEGTRGPDRKWSLAFRVLGRRTASGIVPVEDILTAKGVIGGLSKSAKAFDSSLLDYPAGLEPGFLERVHNAAGSFRAAGAKLRKSINAVGDLAKAPANVANELVGMARDVRATIAELRSTFDDVAIEYQVADANVRSITSARTWRTSLSSPLDDTADQTDGLLDQLERMTRRARRFVPVRVGESLVRIAQRELGAPELWTELASANGLIGQVVPAGVTSLLIPEL